MLNEERKKQIVSIVEKNGSASVQELITLVNASESTIRRDLNELHKQGIIIKVHGGAVSKKSTIVSSDTPITIRKNLNMDVKINIGKYAASLIEEGDTIFIDAGSTTGMMIDYIDAKDVTFITNAVAHARRLSQKGYIVYIPGGYLKANTEAIVGSDAYAFLSNYNYSKAFLGANGITNSAGYTTPDPIEASIKECIFQNSRERFVLADSSKFGQVSAKTFGKFEDAIIITNKDSTNIYSKKSNVISVE